MRDFGLYVHFPYCIQRCTYCDFNTYVVDAIPTGDYTEAVLTEGARRAQDYASWRLATVYFGGGTPSLWGAAGVGRVLRAASQWFPHRAPELEVTLECNPGEAQPGLLAAYREAGVNRLSLGIQALDDHLLTLIHRRHTAQQALEAARTAMAEGFKSVSCDLIFGLSGQDLARWVSDLTTILELGVPHVSLYHLTLEDGTALKREVQAGRIVLPDEDTQADMWEAIETTLAP